jgi:hypothetical protein
MPDCLIFAGAYRLAPKVLGALAIVKPETVIKWHRAGFRSYWRWKSRRRGGRPTVAPEMRELIREMSIANPLWGAPRIHGELLKLGIDIGQTSVAKYMAKRRDPPSQGWRTFLRNHADGIAAMEDEIHMSNTTIIDQATEQLAEYVGSILADKNINKAVELTKVFESYGDYLKSNIAKADVSDPLRGPRDEPDDKKLSAKLDELVAEMIVARPSLHPHRARRWLLHTPQGRELLPQHKSILQKETPNESIRRNARDAQIHQTRRHVGCRNARY